MTKGEATGYYVYSKDSPSYPVPMLHQIFVRKEYRHKGYVMIMTNDFLGTFKKGRVGIESPNHASTQLLIKAGLFVEKDGHWVPTGRVDIYPSPM